MIHNSKISIIVAISKDRGIGNDNKLLWQIPEDMKRFREKTCGHTIIMGRKTFESIGHPLPNRTNIVISRDSSFARRRLAKLKITSSLDEALKMASESREMPKQVWHDNKKEIFIIGGGQIYQQAIGLTDKLYLTIVDAVKDADTFFPEYESIFKKIVFEKEGKWEGHKYKFLELER
ncbi:MAG: dihydrofolate reductase [Candidatus Levyibacteriota bacterium]